MKKSLICFLCQETWLGYYNNDLVVILKDFTTSKVKLRSYKDTRQSSEGTDLSSKEYTHKYILYLIEKHTKMSENMKQKMKEHFWRMFVCDAILGNRDRHHENRGYLYKGNEFRPAPIYDNGGCLFPGVSRVIYKFLENEFLFLSERTERFPASLLRKKG